MFLLWKDFSCNLGNLRLPKKTVIVISAECIYKFVTNLMVFIKGLLIQLFLSFDAEKLMNQLFNPNFFTLPFPPFFVIDCVTFIRVFGSIWGQRFVSSMGKLCEFSTVWADRDGLGSQKSFSKLTSILPRKTYDNFLIDIQKITQIRKKLGSLIFKPKKECGF